MTNNYKTILKHSEGIVIEKKSKFIANIVHVETQEEAQMFINEVKAKYFDARHNVYAYILLDGNVKRYSDDGEPQGTSGIPSLNVLEGEGLYNVCVVITRYFGGTLLGTGGLVRAYSGAVKQAIENSQIVTAIKCINLKLTCDYHLWSKVENISASWGALVQNTDFTHEISADVSVQNEVADTFIKDVVEKTDAKVKIDVLGECFSFVDGQGKLVK